MMDLRMGRTIPALPVREIGTAVEFYGSKLGFTARHHDEGFAIVGRDEAELHLWAASDESWKARSALAARPIVTGAETFLAGTGSCRIEVFGIDDLFLEYERSGVLYDSSTQVEAKPWGTREFPVLDLERNLLTFYDLGERYARAGVRRAGP